MTPEEKQVVQDKVNRTADWTKLFQAVAESSGLKTQDTPEYRRAEKFFWLGVVVAIRATGRNESEFIADEVSALLAIGVSPTLDRKIKQVRIRGPRKQKEAASGQTDGSGQ